MIPPEKATDLTGANPPAETIADQRARGPGIISRTDSLIISTVRGTTNHADLPTYTIPVICQDARCSGINPVSGRTEIITVNDLSSVGDTTTEFSLTKHGVTVFRTRGTVDDSDVVSYGGVMEHSAFRVHNQSFSVNNVNVRQYHGVVGGDLTGSSPSGTTATWRGLMVGTTPANGNLLQGDASLEYSLDAGTLDAAFTEIKDLTRNAAHTTDTVRFDDVSVSTDGTYQAGSTGNRIQGGFYGPDHAESAGVFEQSGIVGAYGAKKQ